MKSILWLILLIPFTVISQIKFKSGTSLLSPAEHFSGSVIGIADMNGDALDDIIRLQSSRLLSIEYQTAPDKPYIHRYIGEIAPYEFWNISIADINQDGLNDMAFTANENVGYIYYSQRLGDSIAYIKQSLNGSANAYAQGANLVDINNDGWLDYFLCSDLGVNKIWANNAQGRITGDTVTWIDFRSVPPSDNSGNYGSIWSDLDNDGDLDLYVAKCKAGANDPKDPRRINTFFKNINGAYTEVAAAAGIALGDQSWTALAGDSDNDGDIDLFVINHFTPSALLINDGQGNFKDAFAQSGISYSAVGVQAAWADLDNDGLLDLIISGSAHHIYRNKGQNKFELMSSAELGQAQIESFSIGDLNQDGLLDMYASYSLVFNEASHRKDELWMNNSSNGNHFLNVRLTGTKSNRSAIGAKITLVTGSSRQTREIYAGQSYGVSATLTQHFGIGKNTKIDTLIVRWPDGTQEKLESPFIDRTLVMKQNTCYGFDPLINPVPTKYVLCNTLDSVTLSSPITGEYHWSNGSTSRSIVVKAPGNYQVKINVSTGCEFISNLISIEKDQKIIYPITISDSVLCEGSKATLSLTVGNKIIQWNTGDTGSAIQVKVSGKYFAKVQNECSSSNTDTVNVRVVVIPPLIVKNDTVALTDRATLTAQSSNSISWFADSEGGSPIGTGNSYRTPSLNKTTTYYAQASSTTKGKTFNGGLKEFMGLSKFHANNFSGKLYFDATQNVILKSVKVYTDTAALREIDLLDATGKIIATHVSKIEKGESRVVLNFSIPLGLGYALSTNDDASLKVFGFKSPLLYRTEAAVPYPLNSGAVTIYGTNAGASTYYYFYDWELSFADLICYGPRIPVQGVIRSVPVNNELRSVISVFPNPVSHHLYVDVGALQNGSLIKVMLFNSIGQIKYALTTSVSGKLIEINTMNLPGGVYFLRLENNGKLGLTKVIIAK